MAVLDLARSLTECLRPDQVLSGPGVLKAYDCDAYTVDKSVPQVVTLPESTEDVQKIVRFCVENEVPFTPRGAGTGLSGGALPALGGIVISTKRLTRILAIDVENRRLKAQTGVANKRISDAVSAYGLHFAPDPSSQAVATLGGNIAENSGGPHTLKYGVTTQHVLAVTMVDPEGEIVELGGRVEVAPGYDLVGLVVGSEGTLGVVTEAWVKLTPLPKAVRTALVAFPDVRGATRAVSEIVASGIIPAALELMDHGILNALRLAFGLEAPPRAQALLLIECDGEPGAPDAEMTAIEAICRSFDALEFRVAGDEKERQVFWTARKRGIGAMGRIAPSIVTHDGVIPRSKLPEMLDFVYETAGKYGVGVANLFHAGDGNLHPCFYFDDRDLDQVRRVVLAGEEVTRRCIELGGSISGEHGVGVEKLDLFAEMFTEDDRRLQADARSIFNSGSLCNPCKVLPNQKSCVEHRRRWRGAAW